MNESISAPDATEAQNASTVLVDARGLLCPEPVIRLARASRSGVPTARVLADDPAARTDIPAFARLRGHHLAAVTDEGDHTAYLVHFDVRTTIVSTTVGTTTVSTTVAAAEPREPT